VAKSIGRKPSSSEFKRLLSCSRTYGLTTGTEKAPEISLDPLGRRIVSPTSPEDKAAAMLEASMKPELFNRVYNHFDQNKMPSGEFFENQLSQSFDVDPSNTSDASDLIRENAEFVGILEDISGSEYIRLSAVSKLADKPAETVEVEGDQAAEVERVSSKIEPKPLSPSAEPVILPAKTRVFISHGRNTEIVDQVKTMLDLADLEYEVAVEEETSAIPVPEKVLKAMRRCNAAIICVSDENGSSDGEPVINQNVLIEIGSAFVLYDQQVVLLWDKKVKVPSNLQGLYRCEFDGEELSWSNGMKLMATLKKFKPAKA
jgi:predicted nucleotide-binding protein